MNRYSRSAYGFSAANGGMNRFVKWMKSTPRNTARFCCYGDDTCIVYRRRDGTLFRIDPDFTQMDGSVDQHLVAYVVATVKDALFAKFGENTFWHMLPIGGHGLQSRQPL